MSRRQSNLKSASPPNSGREAAEDYQALALETLDSLLAGPLAGGLSPAELHIHFPLIRAALRQLRSDLDQAWPEGVGL